MKEKEKSKIAIGSDHAGFELKERLKEFLSERHIVVDKGTYSEESTDYPPYAHMVAKAVIEDKLTLGVLICGSANGVAMTANKHSEVRAAIAWKAEIASLAKAHNNANVVCIPARFVSEQEAKEILNSFLNTEFEGGRHERRVNKISLC